MWRVQQEQAGQKPLLHDQPHESPPLPQHKKLQLTHSFFPAVLAPETMMALVTVPLHHHTNRGAMKTKQLAFCGGSMEHTPPCPISQSCNILLEVRIRSISAREQPLPSKLSRTWCIVFQYMYPCAFALFFIKT